MAQGLWLGRLCVMAAVGTLPAFASGPALAGGPVPPPAPSAVLRSDAPLPVPRPRDLDRPREPQGPPLPPHPRTTTAAPAAAPLPARAQQGPPAPPPTAPTPTAPAPVAMTDCATRLKEAGVVFEPTAVGPQANPACTIAEPVKLIGFDAAGGLPVDFPDRPTLACTTALVFADYLHALLIPLTRGLFGTAVTAVGTGPGFECRTRDHIPGAKISAHAQGLAIDIAEIALSNGRKLAIGTPKDDGERLFDRGARAGACGFFHTALGPGADAFHETHWHFDILPRGTKGDAKICQ